MYALKYRPCISINFDELAYVLYQSAVSCMSSRYNSLVPRPSPDLSTLKNWEWPGYEANVIIHCILHIIYLTQW